MNTVFLFLNLSAFRVPVERQVTDARINITFRWILNHHVRGGCGTDLPGVRIAMIPVSGVPEIIPRTKPLCKTPSRPMVVYFATLLLPFNAKLLRGRWPTCCH